MDYHLTTTQQVGNPKDHFLYQTSNNPFLIPPRHIANIKIEQNGAIYNQKRLSMLLNDNLTDIFGYINAGSDYKAAIFTCKSWHHIMIQTYPQKYIELSNHLTTLLKMFPNKPWNFYGLSSNPNTTWQVVANNPDWPWEWYGLSRNPSITWQTVTDNPDCPWGWVGLSFNNYSVSSLTMGTKR